MQPKSKSKSNNIINYNENPKEIEEQDIINRKLQEELKDSIINKLQDQVAELTNENKDLKTENLHLKDSLTYIIKRLILSKNELTLKYNQNLREKLDENKSFNLFSSVKFNKVTNPNDSESIISYNKINNSNEDLLNKTSKSNKTFKTYNYSNINNNNNLDSKVNSYLNIIYQKYFGNNSMNSSAFFLGKECSIYNELFNNEDENIKNNSNKAYINSEHSTKSIGIYNNSISTTNNKINCFKSNKNFRLNNKNIKSPASVSDRNDIVDRNKKMQLDSNNKRIRASSNYICSNNIVVNKKFKTKSDYQNLYNINPHIVNFVNKPEKFSLNDFKRNRKMLFALEKHKAKNKKGPLSIEDRPPFEL